MPTLADEFLRRNEGREGKREFVRGRVVEMMIDVTRNHVDIATNLLLALRQHLDRETFSVGSANFGVRTPDGIRYSDVFVDRKTAAASADDPIAVEPVFVAEVLSPSSYGRDFVHKLADYKGVDSLIYYLILSHEEPRVWLWGRSPEGWNGPQELAGANAAVDLGQLSVQLSLADLYDGVAVRPVS
ncbi:MAG: Uma2 family endonuclease [Rhizobiaceae bacterium]|nr:Uma2 family endonuclease [Rhizobiaceae bacterium]MCV0404687.1 Uma2 family endonuclease [Rhizobiaceae bacterium]